MRYTTLLTNIGFSLIAAVAQAQNGLIAYDGFGNGPLAELSGSTSGTGWSGPWQDLASTLPISVGDPASGLSAPRLASTPGAARSAGGFLPDIVEYVRSFPAVSGDVMYVSFLLRPESDLSNWFVLRLGGYPYQVDVGVPIGYSAYGFMIGHSTIVTTTTPVVVGRANFLVLEIRHNTVSGGTAYTLYMDPPVGAPKPQVFSASFGRAGLMPFGLGVELLGEGGYTFDEIRIGTTWSAVTPACAADFNRSGAVTVQDIFDFLTAYFTGDGSADVNASGVVTVQDIFDFLAAYFTGC